MLIDRARFAEFLSALGEEFEVFAPYRDPETGHLFLGRFDPEKEMTLFAHRPVDPLMILFSPPRDRVLPASDPPRKRIVLGVKNCDLAALSLLDRALLAEDGFPDLNYRLYREATWIIAADCTEVLPVCHCSLLNLKPYPEEGFDLALSEVAAGYLVRVGSSRGEELAARLAAYSASPSSEESLWEEVARNRHGVAAALREANRDFTPYFFEDAKCHDLENEEWSARAADCVECGGCNYICPTCYCTILSDETRPGEGFRKVRAWDSCQHTGYARVAGGTSPRPRLWQRFRYRYRCKFILMPESFSRSGCTGCGRCIVVCPGKIDLRKVVRTTGGAVKTAGG